MAMIIQKVGVFMPNVLNYELNQENTTKFNIGIMYRFLYASKGCTKIREYLKSIFKKYKVKSETSGEPVDSIRDNRIKAIYDDVKKYFQFLPDPYACELIQTPEMTLKMRAGDCDDLSLFIASCLINCGYNPFFICVSDRKDKKLNHVYVGLNDEKNKKYIPIDLAIPNSRLGLEAKKLTRKEFMTNVDEYESIVNDVIHADIAKNDPVYQDDRFPTLTFTARDCELLSGLSQADSEYLDGVLGDITSGLKSAYNYARNTAEGVANIGKGLIGKVAGLTESVVKDVIDKVGKDIAGEIFELLERVPVLGKYTKKIANLYEDLKDDFVLKSFEYLKDIVDLDRAYEVFRSVSKGDFRKAHELIYTYGENAINAIKNHGYDVYKAAKQLGHTFAKSAGSLIQDGLSLTNQAIGGLGNSLSSVPGLKSVGNTLTKIGAVPTKLVKTASNIASGGNVINNLSTFTRDMAETAYDTIDTATKVLDTIKIALPALSIVLPEIGLPASAIVLLKELISKGKSAKEIVDNVKNYVDTKQLPEGTTELIEDIMNSKDVSEAVKNIIPSIGNAGTAAVYNAITNEKKTNNNINEIENLVNTVENAVNEVVNKYESEKYINEQIKEIPNETLKVFLDNPKLLDTFNLPSNQRKAISDRLDEIQMLKEVFSKKDIQDFLYECANYDHLSNMTNYRLKQINEDLVDYKNTNGENSVYVGQYLKLKDLFMKHLREKVDLYNIYLQKAGLINYSDSKNESDNAILYKGLSNSIKAVIEDYVRDKKDIKDIELIIKEPYRNMKELNRTVQELQEEVQRSIYV